MGGSIWDYVAPALGAAVAIGLGQPELLGFAGPAGFLGGAGAAAVGSGIGSGLATGVETGNPLAGLASGVLGGAGSYAGGQLLGPALGGIGGAANAASGEVTPGLLGRQLGGFVGNVLPGATAGSLAGGAIGSSVGSTLGTSIGQSLNPMNSGGGQGPPAFSPSRSPQMALPQGLSQFSSLDPFQQATNIASKGVYGGGQGNDENQYFLNLINRQLIDPNGNVQNQSSLNPVESSYLSQLGLGGYNNSTDLLKGISQYQG